jgi:hypothetical protein
LNQLIPQLRAKTIVFQTPIYVVYQTAHSGDFSLVGFIHRYLESTALHRTQNISSIMQLSQDIALPAILGTKKPELLSLRLMLTLELVEQCSG